MVSPFSALRQALVHPSNGHDQGQPLFVIRQRGNVLQRVSVERQQVGAGAAGHHAEHTLADVKRLRALETESARLKKLPGVTLNPFQYSDWSEQRSPGSRTRSICACQGPRPRRAACALAMSRAAVLPAARAAASAPRTNPISWLDDWPAHSPADASPASSRTPTHGSGPMCFATPSSRWTCTTYSLPVSRRTTRRVRSCERNARHAC